MKKALSFIIRNATLMTFVNLILHLPFFGPAFAAMKTPDFNDAPARLDQPAEDGDCDWDECGDCTDQFECTQMECDCECGED